MNNLKENLNNVSSRIRRACAAAGREGESVRLLAVCKRQPAAKVRKVYELGQRAFGENTVQEALAKQAELADLDIEWHFIGALQSNKTADVARAFHWAQSVDREKLMRRLSDQRPENLPPINVCLQVNIDREPQKAGCMPEDVSGLAAAAEGYPGIRLRGLMAIPAATADGGAARESFDRMKELYAACRKGGLAFDTLSMGMSSDMERAVAAGSTMVRIGTDLFGPRE